MRCVRARCGRLWKRGGRRRWGGGLRGLASQGQGLFGGGAEGATRTARCGRGHELDEEAGEQREREARAAYGGYNLKAALAEVGQLGQFQSE